MAQEIKKQYSDVPVSAPDRPVLVFFAKTCTMKTTAIKTTAIKTTNIKTV